MEINNIPKIAVNTTTDSHQGVVLFSLATAAAFDGVRRRRVDVVLRRVVPALSQ
jgi:hypothetical protein